MRRAPLRGSGLAALLALAALVALAACTPPAAPKPVTPAEPLVIGKSPPATAVASDRPPPAGDESGRFPRGKAPVISLYSLTTATKVRVPAGRVVVVHFWATWCAPCNKSFPALQALYVKYNDRGLEVAAIAVDDEKGGVANFAKQHGVTFPVAWDEGHKVTEQWKVQSMPSTMLVDKAGNLVATHSGWHDGEEAELEKELAGLL